MQGAPDEPAPQRSRSRLLWCAFSGATLLMASLLLLLSGGLHPANAGSDPDSAPGDDRASVPSNFGSAMPSDKFVQSFQQQVSRQLQDALSQSSKAQENRLRQFEQEQRELSDQLQALEQTLDRSGDESAKYSQGKNRDPNVDDRQVEAPRINVRRPNAAETADVSGGQGLTASFGGLLSNATGEAGAIARGDAMLPGLNALPFAELAPEGLSQSANAAATSHHAGDPNIAPHGFVEGRLLNGVVAIVGGPDRESIVALSGQYRSANGFLDDLDGCFALVQGKPEIAAGRIDFKLSRLTCNFPDGASRTWDTAGWLVDADGIRGIRATIVENLGRKAAVAAAGGALGGVGQRLSQEQYQVSSIGGLGSAGALGSTSAFVGNPGQDALGGAATGAANAIGQSIADYYNLYSPSLQIGGGTPVTVVLANDLRVPSSGRAITQTHTAGP
jgi:conjugal transfer pilus assembly protein TraB